MQPKNIVVVGGSHGIGAGIVAGCLAGGAVVTVFSRTPVAEELMSAGAVTHHSLDVLQDDIPAEQLPDTIHGFAYCPGSISLGMLRSVKPQVMRDDFELNVVGAVRSLQAALPGLKAAGQSSAVFFGTVAVAQGLPMHTSIAAAKGALEALVRTWAAELAPNVRVNCISPALTNTPLAARLLSSDEKRKSMAARYPLERVGEVEDMAATATFLLGESSGWITGQILRVDGGMSVCRS